jgi:hypothetical protein
MSDCARALLLLHKSQNSGPVPKGVQVAGATTLKKEMSAEWHFAPDKPLPFSCGMVHYSVRKESRHAKLPTRPYEASNLSEHFIIIFDTSLLDVKKLLLRKGHDVQTISCRAPKSHLQERGLRKSPEGRMLDPANPK